MRAVVLAILLAVSAHAEDLVLVNGSIIDGTGKLRAAGNVRIRDDKIADVGAFKPMPDEHVIDVNGMIVAPGFIDFQSLAVDAAAKESETAALLSQGVTTAVLGSDAKGPYSVEDFMLPFDEKPPALNIAMLVGHATVRRQIMGADYKRASTPDELERMGELVSDAMKQGAFGFASNLQEEPESFSTPSEVTALVKIVAKFGGVILLRARDGKEAVALAREAKIPVQVLSPDKTVSAEIDRARAQRIDISSDSYSLSQMAKDKTASLERGIQRMTGTPAGRIGLRERGAVRKGAAADLVVFDPASLASGIKIKYVFINGTVVLKDGEPAAVHAGQALR
jgi:N-acyl-D-amino-acid deacylase